MRLLFHSALEGHELAEMFVEQNIVPLYEFMSAYISQRQADGAIRGDLEPRVIIRAFVGMMIHHSLNNSLWDKKATDSEYFQRRSGELVCRDYTERNIKNNFLQK